LKFVHIVMAHAYLFLAAGVIAAAAAVIVWLSSTEQRARPQRSRPERSRPGPSGSCSSSANIVRQRPGYQSEPSKECMICCDSDVTTKFLPCQHACMCEECAIKYMNSLEENGWQERCPLCRHVIHSFEMI